MSELYRPGGGHPPIPFTAPKTFTAATESDTVLHEITAADIYFRKAFLHGDDGNTEDIYFGALSGGVIGSVGADGTWIVGSDDGELLNAKNYGIMSANPPQLLDITYW